jgi:hypothetical protein
MYKNPTLNDQGQETFPEGKNFETYKPGKYISSYFPQ